MHFHSVLDEEMGIVNNNIPERTSQTKAISSISTTPIYRYYIYGGANSDHYSGSEAPPVMEKGTLVTIKNRRYTFEFHEFDVLNKPIQGYTVPLYRYYRSDGMNNVLSKTFIHEEGYTYEKLLGYIFTSQ